MRTPEEEVVLGEEALCDLWEQLYWVLTASSRAFHDSFDCAWV
jgi:hypothetical protein